VPNHPHLNRIPAICLSLLAGAVAWLALFDDDAAHREPPPSEKTADSSAVPADAIPQHPQPPRPPEADKVAPALSSTEEAIVNEILQIRREQGGLLEGTLLEELSGSAPQLPGQPAGAPGRPDDDFARALRGVAAAASSQSGLPQSGPTQSGPTQSGPTGNDRESTAFLQEDAADRREVPSDDGDLIALLRLTARRLDCQSADFEEANDYRRAARCRSAANQLRRLARELREHPPQAVSALRPPVPPAPLHDGQSHDGQ